MYNTTTSRSKIYATRIYAETHGQFRVITDYKNLATPVRYQHHSKRCVRYDSLLNHYYSFRMRPSIFKQHLIHHKLLCPAEEVKRKTTIKNNHFDKRLYRLTHGEYRRKSDYLGCREHIFIEHHSKKCPFYKEYHKYYIFTSTPHRLSNLTCNDNYVPCPKDQGNKTQFKANNNLNFIKNILKTFHGEYIPLTPYENFDTPILFAHYSKRCNWYKVYHHYYLFLITPRRLHKYKRRSNIICPRDQDRCNNSWDYDFRVLKATYGQIYPVLKWQGATKPMLFVHYNKRCNYYRKYHKYFYFYKRKACYITHSPVCPIDNAYKGELKIMHYLEQHGLKRNKDFYHSYILNCQSPFSKQKLHADFYLPSIHYSRYYYNGVIIEFDGSQHFHKVNWSSHMSYNTQIDNLNGIRIRDRVKNVYCYHKHIKMIRIENKKDVEGKGMNKLIVEDLNRKLLDYL